MTSYGEDWSECIKQVNFMSHAHTRVHTRTHTCTHTHTHMTNTERTRKPAESSDLSYFPLTFYNEPMILRIRPIENHLLRGSKQAELLQVWWVWQL